MRVIMGGSCLSGNSFEEYVVFFAAASVDDDVGTSEV